jgi:hypothetical protein
VNEVDIEEIALISSIDKGKRPKDPSTSGKDRPEDKPRDWNTQLERAKLENNPYLPI